MAYNWGRGRRASHISDTFLAFLSQMRHICQPVHAHNTDTAGGFELYCFSVCLCYFSRQEITESRLSWNRSWRHKGPPLLRNWMEQFTFIAGICLWCMSCSKWSLAQILRCLSGASTTSVFVRSVEVIVLLELLLKDDRQNHSNNLPAWLLLNALLQWKLFGE